MSGTGALFQHLPRRRTEADSDRLYCANVRVLTTSEGDR